MNSRAFVVLLVAALTYILFVIAHERWDRPTDPTPTRPSTAGDVSAEVAALLTEGLSAIPALRESLATRAPDLVAILPTAPEDWQARVRALLADPPKPPYGRVELAVSEPRGLQLMPRLLLRRELPGSARVEILAVESKEILATFEAQVNRPQRFPDDLVFEPGGRYLVRATNDPTSEDRVTAEFAIVGNDELLALQQGMAVLKNRVSDTRLRIYLQACLAMSRGLQSEATETLLGRLPPLEGERKENGLAERLVFLFDRRGETVARDRIIGILRKD